MTELRSDAQTHLVPHYTKGAAWRDENLLLIERGEGCYCLLYTSDAADE